MSSRRTLLVWTLLVAEFARFGQGCQCGLATSDRMYNGKAVQSSKQYPWMGMLLSQRGDTVQQCGATMITTQYALSAGHCYPGLGYQTKMYFGLNGLYKALSSSVGIPVSRFITASNGRRGKDIALVVLSKSVNVQPICLPPKGVTYAGVKATMLGFGRTESGKVSDRLLVGNIMVPSNLQCSRVQPVYPSEICGGNYGGGPAFCSGDSGGPLMYQDTNSGRWTIIGVVSASYECDDTRTYGIFTRVSSYVDSIQKEIKNVGCVAS